jgi:hypothetical protein
MPKPLRRAALLTLLAALPFVLAADDGGFQDTFDVPKDQFTSTGKNDFFILEPGYQMTFQGTSRSDRNLGLVITVLDETKTVDGIETRVVEERETVDGKPIEVSRNYFAVDRRNNDVYYFGEDVDDYDKSGKIAGHGGSWHAGKDGARFGLIMPAKPKVGQKYYQEVAPKKAMDRAEAISLDERLTVPAGAFTKCLKTRETTPLEPEEPAHQHYAPGVGLLIDGSMKLVKYGSGANDAPSNR